MADAPVITTTTEKPALPAVPPPNATEIPDAPKKKAFAQFVQAAEESVPASDKPEPKARVEKETPVEKAPEKKEEPEKKEPVAEKSPRSAMREAVAKAEEKARANHEASKEEKKEPAKEEPAKPKRFADDFIEPTDTKPVRNRINDLGARIEGEIKAREKAAAEAEELRKQIAELTKKASELPPDVKEKLDRAQMLQRRLDIESDPEIKTKFDDRIANAEKSVQEILKNSLGLNEGSLATIEKAGGLAAFSRSKGQFNWKSADGTEEKISASELYSRWLGELPAGEADVIRGMITQQVMVKGEKDRYIAENSAKAKEFFETEAKSRTEQIQKAQQAQKQVVESIAKTINDSIAGADWLKDAEIPNDEEAAAQVKEENAIRALARKTAKEAVSMSDPQDIAELVLDSVRVHYVDRKLRVAEARIAELEAETTRLKNGSRTIPRNGSGRAAEGGSAAAKPAREPGESSFAYNTRMAIAAAEARGS